MKLWLGHLCDQLVNSLDSYLTSCTICDHYMVTILINPILFDVNGTMAHSNLLRYLAGRDMCTEPGC